MMMMMMPLLLPFLQCQLPTKIPNYPRSELSEYWTNTKYIFTAIRNVSLLYQNICSKSKPVLFVKYSDNVNCLELMRFRYLVTSTQVDKPHTRNIGEIEIFAEFIFVGNVLFWFFFWNLSCFLFRRSFLRHYIFVPFIAHSLIGDCFVTIFSWRKSFGNWSDNKK